MIDTSTHQPLCVSTDGGAGPYIMLPLSQLEAVRTLLTDKGVAFWVDEEVISLDGKPEIAVINLERGCNSAMVQELLDSIP